MLNAIRIVCIAALAALVCYPRSESVVAQTEKSERYWIWSSDSTLASAPGGSRYFRRTLELKGAITAASIEITADNHFVVWINGKQIGSGDEWQQLHKFDVAKSLQTGKNIVAVEGKNDGNSPAGLLATLT